MSQILLVDDQPIVNFITKKLLELEGYLDIVYDYTNPVEALEALQNDKSTLIFLDLNMPEMDGWEFLDNLEKINTSKINVVILSSSCLDCDIEKANSHAMVVDYMVKPINKEKLHKIAKYLPVIKK